MKERVVLLGVVLALGGLGAWAPPGAAADDGPPNFVDVASEAGLTFKCEHWNKNIGLAPRWFIDISPCSSPVMADFNGDGYLDVYFPNQRYTNVTLNDQLDPQDGLFLNDGDGTFTEVTSLVGIHDRGYSRGAAAIDHDGDGDLDIYVGNFVQIPAGFNQIASPSTTFYVNNGDGTFTQASHAALGLITAPRLGFLDSQWGEAVAVGDYDRDGDVDLYRGHYAAYDLRTGMPSSLQLTVPDTNILFENQGDGTFLDLTVERGASQEAGRTFGVNMADYDEDGWPDIYVANDENPNELYLNRPDGVGGRRFLTPAQAGIASTVADPRGAMCSETADLSGDGHLDLYFSHYEDENNGYYTGNGDGTFVNQETLGDLDVSKNFLGWGCPSLDYDNDGDLDLFVANGHHVPLGGEFFHPEDPDDDNGYELPNFLFQNRLREDGVHSWTEIGRAGNAGPGLEERKVSGGAVAGDFDLDGVMEIVVMESNDAPVSFYRNTAPTDNHWLSVDLRGTASNTFGINAKVLVGSGALSLFAERLTGNSLGSGSVAPLHFGLGDNAGPATVTVTWPSGLVQTEVVPVDAPVRIVEGSGADLDTLAPRVDVAIDGVAGANGWWTSESVTVTLDAVERGIADQTGVAGVSYRVDAGPLTPYGGPFELTGEGKHKLTTFATDGAGNSAWYVQEIRIDHVLPDCQIATPLAGHVYAQDRDQGASADGGTFIVAPVQTPNDDVEDADDKVRDLRRHVNRELVGAGVPAEVPKPPTTGKETMAQTVGSDGRTSFLVDAQDATSRVASVEFYLDDALVLVDVTAPYEWVADLRGQPAGEHMVTVMVTDYAGHRVSDDLSITVVPSTQDGVMNTVFSLLLDPPTADSPERVGDAPQIVGSGWEVSP